MRTIEYWACYYGGGLNIAVYVEQVSFRGNRNGLSFLILVNLWHLRESKLAANHKLHRLDDIYHIVLSSTASSQCTVHSYHQSTIP